MLPPSSLICVVTTASPIHTIAKTPEKTWLFCSGLALKLSSELSSKQNTNGPHRSQSRSPLLMPPPPLNRFSASIALPARFRISSLAPDIPPWRKPSYAPRRLVVLSSMLPPNRYLGYKTSRIFCQTAIRSRLRVAQTDSSMVLVDALRSSPGIVDVR